MRWDCGIFCLTKSGDRCTKTSGFALQATNALQKDTTMVHQFTFLEIWFRGACGFCIVAALCYENAVSRDIYIYIFPEAKAVSIALRSEIVRADASAATGKPGEGTQPLPLPQQS